MPDIVLSRDNPLLTVNRWGVTDGARLLCDEDGRTAIFHDRGAAERHVALFTLYHGQHAKYQAVPVPFTPEGKAPHYMRVLTNMVLLGVRINDMSIEECNAFSWAHAVTHWHMPTDTNADEDAALYLEHLARLGFKP